MLATGIVNAHKKVFNEDNEHGKLILGGFTVSLVFIAVVIDVIIYIGSYYFFFKCNFGEGIRKSAGDKFLEFLAACCCHLFYFIYRIAVPC
tara:strand:- start:118 stop:390 length:273 start_codon:yes stop_codon:yes gene_type:complete